MTLSSLLPYSLAGCSPYRRQQPPIRNMVVIPSLQLPIPRNGYRHLTHFFRVVCSFCTVAKWLIDFL